MQIKGISILSVVLQKYTSEQIALTQVIQAVCFKKQETRYFINTTKSNIDSHILKSYCTVLVVFGYKRREEEVVVAYVLDVQLIKSL